MAKLPLLFYLAAFASLIQLARCQPSNILWANQLINENQTLVSPNKLFELGFFTPESSTNQYLGIWYTTPNKTIVWVANVDNPISGGNGSLFLTQEGVLVLRNNTDGAVWFRGRQTTNAFPVAILSDLGTLVINNTATGEYLWQSSYELSNTLLPLEYLGYIMLANVDIQMQLTSWKNETDPSPGRYVYRLDPTRLYELVIVFGDAVTFRTGPWNGSHWNGMTQLGDDSSVAFNLKQSDGGAYFYYYPINHGYIFRLVMNPTGKLSFWRSNQTSAWEQFQQIPPENSGQYALCGPYGTSDGTTCACPDAFMPKSPTDWKSGKFSQGCVRAETFECSTALGFVNVTNVKLPDTINAKANNSILNLEGCTNWCKANCSCMAVAMVGSQGCVGWFGELIDTVKLVNGKLGDTLYIRVAGPLPPPPGPTPSPVAPAPESTKKKLKKIMEYAAMPAAIVACLLLAALCIQCCRWRREKIVRLPTPNTKIDTGEDDLTIFEFSTLKSATNNFSERNKLGGGQFGLVYKGILSDGEEIAVKRLARNSREGIGNPKKEVALLARLRHPNLVKLLGFCVQEEEMLLCYEYVHRSLDQLLFGHPENQNTLLDWGMRYSILERISAGLLYLHEDSGRVVIHCEIKPSNILLDQNMVPKISDFGLSQLFDQDGFFVKLCMVTSCGHRAPELKKKMLSTCADVYSFGVLILELVTGQRNSSFPSGLIAHVLQYWEEGNLKELIDPKLKNPFPVNEIERCINIALLSLLEQPQMRPKMRDINHMLTNKQAPLPNLPHNSSYWGLMVMDSSTTFEEISLL